MRRRDGRDIDNGIFVFSSTYQSDFCIVFAKLMRKLVYRVLYLLTHKSTLVVVGDHGCVPYFTTCFFFLSSIFLVLYSPVVVDLVHADHVN